MDNTAELLEIDRRYLVHPLHHPEEHKAPLLVESGKGAMLHLADGREVIDGLAADPRPPGFQPLTGHRPYLRVRSGDYRVIYTVDDSARVVTIAAVGHRREIYRRLGL